MKSPDEKLHCESRICPRCQCQITSPLTARCPRCLTALPLIDPGCNVCLHSSKCAIANAAKFDAVTGPR